MSIACIIPMYGKESYTRKCVELVKANHGLTDCHLTILVVDDGSETPFVDDTIDVLRLDKNSGFTAATNQGILWCGDRYEYILLLNNDTEPEPDFLAELLKIMQTDENIGIVASTRIHPSREQKYELCGSDLIRGYQYFVDEKDLAKAPESMEVNWVPLCSGLLRMSMIREIGLLDKRFRNHCSDSSYCLWAKINHWKVILSIKSKVIHHLSVTTHSNGVSVDQDQKKFLEKLAGLDYAQIMAHMPLDGEAKTWGKLLFEVYKK